MWVTRKIPTRCFDFTLDSGSRRAKAFSEGVTQRFLLADAYGGYNGVVAGNAITRAGCWAPRETEVLWMRRKPHRRSHGRR